MAVPALRMELLRRPAVVTILALSAALQFYDLDTRQLFLGDQALHAQVARDIVLHGLRPLVGPPLAALPGTNMGPIFYYMSALPVWVTGGWPTGGAALVGAFQVATVYLLYRLGRAAVGTAFGLTAAVLYATSGVVVYWERMLWPNMVPWCAVAMLWALLVLARRRGSRGEGWAAVALVAALCTAVQLQPTAFLLAPLAGAGVLLGRPRRPARWAVAAGMIVGLALVAPLIVNELTTHLSQTRAWIGYLHQTRHATAGGLRDTLVYLLRSYRGLVGLDSSVPAAVAAGASGGAVLVAARAGRLPGGAPRTLLARLCLIWGALFVLALALGHQQIYPHYFIPLFPLPFLALAFLVEPLWRRRGTVLPGVVLVVALAGWNVHGVWANSFGLARAALLDPSDVQTPNLTLGTLRDVTRGIATAMRGAPYNFELLSPADYPTDYKYLLRLEGALPSHPPVGRKVVVVQPASLAPAAWPAWVADGLRRARPRFWLFNHVAVWAWDARMPLPAIPGFGLAGSIEATRFVTALALGRGSALWSGSPAGVAVSPDGGRSWSAARPLRPDGGAAQPQALLLDPTGSGWAYAATVGGVAVSAGAGRAWRPVGGCPNRTFALLSPTARLRLAGDTMGLCISRDAGRTWRHQEVVTGVGSASWERRHPQPLYAFWQAGPSLVLAGSGSGLLASRDGTTWRRVGAGDVGMTALLVANPGNSAQQAAGGAWATPAAPLYAGTAAGVLRSTTGGQTWQRIDGGLAEPYVFALAQTTTAHGAVVWAATATGLFRLDPHQDRWALVEGRWARDAAALSVAARGRTVVVGTDGGAYRSDDGGDSWRPLPPPPVEQPGARA